MTSIGVLVNHRASLGSRLVQLNEIIPALEKQSKKTLPKTLTKEWDKVNQAKFLLNEALIERAFLSLAWKEAKQRLIEVGFYLR